MLKIVSALNGSSVCQSVTTLGIELQLQLKKILFKKNIFFNKLFFKIFFVFLEKSIFWLIFVGHIPCKTTYGRRPTKKLFFQKKNIFFCFLEKMKKIIFGWNFFLVIFRGRPPMEDDMANNFTSLHFPDTCVTSI